VAGRKKHLPDDAEPITISLTPKQQLVLQVVKMRRKERSEERSTPSEIVADGLWLILTEVEGVPKEAIDALSVTKSTDKLKEFPKKESL
jgi:hypothetical protein